MRHDPVNRADRGRHRLDALSTSYGAVPLAADADTLFVVAGADPTLDKPGTVFRFDPSSEDVAAWRQMADPDGVAANQLIRPIAVAAEAGRLAITTSATGSSSTTDSPRVRPESTEARR